MMIGEYLPEISEQVFELISPPVMGLSIYHDFEDDGGIGYQIEVYTRNENVHVIGEDSPFMWGTMYLKVQRGEDTVKVLSNAILKAVAAGELFWKDKLEDSARWYGACIK